MTIAPYQDYVALYFPNSGVMTAGPRHLVMTFNTGQGVDMFVVPDAIDVVESGPPAISSLTQNGDGSVTVAAAGLTAASRIFFDGLQAKPTVAFQSTDAGDGAITVIPPAGASGQKATVTVFTADNQNSMLVQSANPVTYAYPVATLRRSPRSIPRHCLPDSMRTARRPWWTSRPAIPTSSRTGDGRIRHRPILRCAASGC